MLGKNRRKKVRKLFFYILTNIVTKKLGEQNARNNFSRNTLIVGAKNGKKSSEKSAKNVLLYSHEYRDQKMGWKNLRNNFYRNTRIVNSKNVGEKIVGKSAKNVFLFHTNTVTKK